MCQSVVLGTDTLTEADKEVFAKLCPPYKVILHNDDHNDMLDVITALTKSVPSLSEQDAVRIMMTAHNEGTAIVVVVPQEAAEFYQERILSFNINCTIEPDK